MVSSRLTKNDELNCSRFGCTFRPRANLMCIPWQYESASARSSEMQVQILLNEYPSAPVLSLAFQISRTKVLPYHCYFPFDIRNEVHAKYLAEILKTGKIYISLLTTPRPMLRTHEISAIGRAAVANLLEKSLAHSNSISEGAYDFGPAVAEFERKVRLPDYFQCVLTGSEIRLLAEAFEREGAKAAPDQKAHAEKIATALLGIFSLQHEKLVLDFMKQIPSIRQGLLFMSDLHDHFHNDFDGFKKFVVNAIASHSSKAANVQLEAQLPLLALLVRFVEHIRKTDVSDQHTSAGWEADLGEIAKRIANEGLSFKKLKDLVSLFGFQGGPAGRPAKDYSAEYELRAKGRKWREVAEYAYQNHPEIRRDFGGIEFRDLTRAQREDLMHRVREAIRGYAKLQGKVFPSPKRIGLLASGGEQKTPV